MKLGALLTITIFLSAILLSASAWAIDPKCPTKTTKRPDRHLVTYSYSLVEYDMNSPNGYVEYKMENIVKRIYSSHRNQNDQNVDIDKSRSILDELRNFINNNAYTFFTECSRQIDEAIKITHTTIDTVFETRKSECQGDSKCETDLLGFLMRGKAGTLGNYKEEKEQIARLIGDEQNTINSIKALVYEKHLDRLFMSQYQEALQSLISKSIKLYQGGVIVHVKRNKYIDAMDFIDKKNRRSNLRFRVTAIGQYKAYSHYYVKLHGDLKLATIKGPVAFDNYMDLFFSDEFNKGDEVQLGIDLNQLSQCAFDPDPNLIRSIRSGDNNLQTCLASETSQPQMVNNYPNMVLGVDWHGKEIAR